MKKYIVLIIFILSSFNISTKEINPKFRLAVDVWSNPFLFENSFDIVGFSLNGSLMTGVKINKFTVGIEVYENYFSLNNKNDFDDLSLAWNILRGTANLYYEPISWFELMGGVGGAWYRTACADDEFGIAIKNEGGPSFIINCTFKPWKYMGFKLLNRLDIFFNKNGTVTPYYNGGLRVVFNPYVDFINIYIEASGLPWVYNVQKLLINSGLFTWAAGISFDIVFPYNFKKYLKDQKEKKEENGPDENITKLSKANKNEVVYFPNIIFKGNSGEMTKESLDLLDEIIKILKKRDNLIIEIGIHTKDSGNMKSQMELSSKRLGSIEQYFYKNDIGLERIKTINFRGFDYYFSKISKNGTLVQIKILE